MLFRSTALTVTITVLCLTFGGVAAVLVAVAAMTVRAFVRLRFGLLLAAEKSLQPAEEAAGFLLLAWRGLRGGVRTMFALAMFARFTAGAMLERTLFASLAILTALAALAAIPTVASLPLAAFAGLERGAFLAVRGGFRGLPADGRPVDRFGGQNV